MEKLSCFNISVVLATILYQLTTILGIVAILQSQPKRERVSFIALLLTACLLSTPIALARGWLVDAGTARNQPYQLKPRWTWPLISIYTSTMLAHLALCAKCAFAKRHDDKGQLLMIAGTTLLALATLCLLYIGIAFFRTFFPVLQTISQWLTLKTSIDSPLGDSTALMVTVWPLASGAWELRYSTPSEGKCNDVFPTTTEFQDLFVRPLAQTLESGPIRSLVFDRFCLHEALPALTRYLETSMASDLHLLESFSLMGYGPIELQVAVGYLFELKGFPHLRYLEISSSTLSGEHLLSATGPLQRSDSPLVSLDLHDSPMMVRISANHVVDVLGLVQMVAILKDRLVYLNLSACGLREMSDRELQAFVTVYLASVSKMAFALIDLSDNTFSPARLQYLGARFREAGHVVLRK